MAERDRNGTNSEGVSRNPSVSGSNGREESMDAEDLHAATGSGTGRHNNDVQVPDQVMVEHGATSGPIQMEENIAEMAEASNEPNLHLDVREVMQEDHQAQNVDGEDNVEEVFAIDRDEFPALAHNNYSDDEDGLNVVGGMSDENDSEGEVSLADDVEDNEEAEEGERRPYAYFFWQRQDSDNDQEDAEPQDVEENVEEFDVNLPGRHLYLQEADEDDDEAQQANEQPPPNPVNLLPPPPDNDGQQQQLRDREVDEAAAAAQESTSDQSRSTPDNTTSPDNREQVIALPPRPFVPQTIRLPVIQYNRQHNSLLVMPGVKMPLRVRLPRDRAVILAAIKTPLHAFVCLDLRQSGPTYGCVMCILQATEVSDSLHVIAQATQRYRLKDVHTELTGVVVAEVEPLPELSITAPLNSIRLRGADRHLEPTEKQKLVLNHMATMSPSFTSSRQHPSSMFQCCCHNLSSRPRVNDTHRQMDLMQHNQSLNRKRQQVRRYNSTLTPYPEWVYRQCDVYRLSEQIRPYLVAMAKGRDGVQIPVCPSEVCRYACLNLPLPDTHRSTLLQLHCQHQRLRYILDLLEKWHHLVCKECQAVITQRDDVIIISAEGSQSAFVNPGGYVHEMITVCVTDKLHLLGRPTTRHSWFPGYAWIIANCSSCRQHVGWKFTATRSNLRPKKFYGLTRSGVMPK